MKNLWIRILGILFFCFLFIAQDVSASGALNSERAQKKDQGTAAPVFALKTVSGKSVSLKDFQGKGVILFFFTTWCPYCREKIPMLSKNREAYRDQNIEILLIDVGETLTKVSSFIAKEKLSFDIILDSTTKTAEDYGVLGVPTFVLISKEGHVVYTDNELPRDCVSRLQ